MYSIIRILLPFLNRKNRCSSRNKKRNSIGIAAGYNPKLVEISPFNNAT
jgi:hypothetical protein